ncbi:hypothetical protein GCM10009691_24740 [Brevibacterium picturae]|uniref:Uncharacterized protein n=1 Tax=Brevibacterium picturae TaxID=260553 RepID=A0ABP4MSH9_9MICO
MATRVVSADGGGTPSLAIDPGAGLGVAPGVDPDPGVGLGVDPAPDAPELAPGAPETGMVSRYPTGTVGGPENRDNSAITSSPASISSESTTPPSAQSLLRMMRPMTPCP